MSSGRNVWRPPALRSVLNGADLPQRSQRYLSSLPRSQACGMVRGVALDLNCDLGEGEPAARTRRLMRCITSANVACGGHAGDAATMARCVHMATELGVRLGAHPGLRDRRGFGRQARVVSPDELEDLVTTQVRRLQRIAERAGVALHHIKLHGALYHATEQHPALARRFLRLVARAWPGVIIFARAQGRVAALAPKNVVWEEAFLDRHYRDDGTLVPRDQPGAVGSSRVDLQACKLEYSIVSPK